MFFRCPSVCLSKYLTGPLLLNYWMDLLQLFRNHFLYGSKAAHPGSCVEVFRTIIRCVKSLEGGGGSKHIATVVRFSFLAWKIQRNKVPLLFPFFLFGCRAKDKFYSLFCGSAIKIVRVLLECVLIFTEKIISWKYFYIDVYFHSFL